MFNTTTRRIRRRRCFSLRHISHAHLFSISFLRRRRRISFFFGQTVLSFFSSASVRQIREKFLKNETKEEEKKNGHLHKKALRVSSKSALCTREKKRRKKEEHKERDSIASILFSSSRSLSLSLSLSSAFVNVARHTFIFPGKISNFKKRTKHVRNAKE